MIFNNQTLDVDEFLLEFNETVDDCRRYCLITRSKELQKQACAKLDELQTLTTATKTMAQKQNLEDEANALLSCQCAIEALKAELQMWIALKDDDPNRAWDLMIMAQVAACAAIRAHPIASHLESFVRRLQHLELCLFPRQTYMSAGVIIKRSECTLCRVEYEDCPHIAGKAYMGEFCVIQHMELKTLKEVSIVDDPENKRCRVQLVDNVDVMTLLRRVSDEKPVEQAADEGASADTRSD